MSLGSKCGFVNFQEVVEATCRRAKDVQGSSSYNVLVTG